MWIHYSAVLWNPDKLRKIEVFRRFRRAVQWAIMAKGKGRGVRDEVRRCRHVSLRYVFDQSAYDFLNAKKGSVVRRTG